MPLDQYLILARTLAILRGLVCWARAPSCSGTSITAGTLTAAQYQQTNAYDVDVSLTTGPSATTPLAANPSSLNLPEQGPV